MDFNNFIENLALRGHSFETVKAYKSDLDLFGKYLDSRAIMLRQVTPTVIGEFKAYMKTKPGRKSESSFTPATIARRMATVSQLFKFRCLQNPRRKNPAQIFNTLRTRNQKLNDHQGKAVDDQSVETLIQGIDNPRDRAIYSLFIASGLRLSELAQLDIDSLTEERETDSSGNDRVYGSGTVIGKGNKERRFYFDQDAINTIAEYLAIRRDTCPALFISERGTRLSKRAIQFTLDAWCKRLGLRHIHVHALRHTFATNLANANIEPMVLQALMGHSNYETTTRYFRLADDMKARQYHAAMEFVRGLDH